MFEKTNENVAAIILSGGASIPAVETHTIEKKKNTMVIHLPLGNFLSHASNDRLQGAYYHRIKRSK